MNGDGWQGRCPCTPPKGFHPFGIPSLRHFMAKRVDVGCDDILVMDWGMGGFMGFSTTAWVWESHILRLWRSLCLRVMRCGAGLRGAASRSAKGISSLWNPGFASALRMQGGTG